MNTTVLNIKISELKKKMLDTSSLVTATTLTTKISEAENKIPEHAKHITTPEFNKLTAEDFTPICKLI